MLKLPEDKVQQLVSAVKEAIDVELMWESVVLVRPLHFCHAELKMFCHAMLLMCCGAVMQRGKCELNCHR